MSRHTKSRELAGLGSLWRGIRMVGWSFFGVRRDEESRQDRVQVGPLHLIAAALVGIVVFVLGLIALVNWVVAS